MKVIFLDIDGVLNSNDTLQKIHYHQKFKGISPKCAELDEDNIRNLNNLVRQTNAKIVLHSSWRYGYSQYDGAILTAFREMNLHVDDIVSVKIPDKDKAISDYIKNHPDISHYVILDDYPLFPSHESSFIEITADHGLTESYFPQILKLLGYE